MKFELLSGFFTRNHHRKPAAVFLFCSLLLCGTTAGYAADKSYLRLERNKSSDLNDLKITSIGGLVYENEMQAHIGLTHLESDVVGDSLALDFGGGYVFGRGVSLFLGVGASLDYNLDTKDFNDKYFAEAGVVFDLSSKLSLSVRQQHFFNQSDDYEEVIMFGLLFRN